MRFSLLTSLLLPLVAVSVSASNVIDLDDGNFSKIVGGAKGSLVEFFVRRFLAASTPSFVLRSKLTHGTLLYAISGSMVRSKHSFYTFTNTNELKQNANVVSPSPVAFPLLQHCKVSSLDHSSLWNFARCVGSLWKKNHSACPWESAETSPTRC